MTDLIRHALTRRLDHNHFGQLFCHPTMSGLEFKFYM
jgi:hypothetical protein